VCPGQSIHICSLTNRILGGVSLPECLGSLTIDDLGLYPGQNYLASLTIEDSGGVSRPECLVSLIEDSGG
jgi:hypothetical protein